ncbi:MAG: preprotein translocase subunit SecG [Ruminococcus sp.]|nr:preprotein translocase subunit SecG [Ruminococcus sp.]
MSTLEIISGILLLLSCIAIIIIVLVQESKEQGLNSAIGGGSNDSFYATNKSRTRDAKLSRITKIAAVILFVVTIVVNFIDYRL